MYVVYDANVAYSFQITSAFVDLHRFFLFLCKIIVGCCLMYLFDNFMGDFELIAKTFQGLEEVLAKELVALGANNVQLGRRMVSFTGDKELMYSGDILAVYP